MKAADAEQAAAETAGFAGGRHFTRRETVAPLTVLRAIQQRDMQSQLVGAGDQLQRDWALLPPEVAASIVQADSLAVEAQTLYDIMLETSTKLDAYDEWRAGRQPRPALTGRACSPRGGGRPSPRPVTATIPCSPRDAAFAKAGLPTARPRAVAGRDRRRFPGPARDEPSAAAGSLGLTPRADAARRGGRTARAHPLVRVAAAGPGGESICGQEQDLRPATAR